jgi:hypothetical protein
MVTCVVFDVRFIDTSSFLHRLRRGGLKICEALRPTASRHPVTREARVPTGHVEGRPGAPKGQ